MNINIGIENEWWSDPRRFTLAKRLSGELSPDSLAIADGTMIKAWNLAKRYWVKEELVPIHAWLGSDISDAVFESGLAEKRGNNVYVRGSARYLEMTNQEITEDEIETFGGLT